MNTDYIVDADDFHEGNHSLGFLHSIKMAVPKFKITLFCIPGLCSIEFVNSIKKFDWIDLCPHGWIHPSSRECQFWSYEESLEYLNKIEPYGFTKGIRMPGWQISDGMYKALVERGYWLSDQPYNDNRRPKELKQFKQCNNWLHYHIGHMGGHNVNEISGFVPYLKTLTGDFHFIKDRIGD